MNGTIFDYEILCSMSYLSYRPTQGAASSSGPAPIGSVAYDGCSFHLDLMSGGYSLHSICLTQLSQCIILTSPRTIPYSMLRI